MTPLRYLTDLRKQLKERKIMIGRYLEHPEKWIGNYKPDDLEKIEREIKDCDVAIEAIEKRNKK